MDLNIITQLIKDYGTYISGGLLTAIGVVAGLKRKGIKMFRPKFKLEYHSGALTITCIKSGEFDECKLEYANEYTITHPPHGYETVSLSKVKIQELKEKGKVVITHTQMGLDYYPKGGLIPIIWKLKWYSTESSFWLVTTECFDWNGFDNWVSRNWKEYYAIEERWTYIFLMTKLRKKDEGQIKIWKKKNKKIDKKEKGEKVMSKMEGKI